MCTRDKKRPQEKSSGSANYELPMAAVINFWRSPSPRLNVDMATLPVQASGVSPLLASSNFWWLPEQLGLFGVRPSSASGTTQPSPLLSI